MFIVRCHNYALDFLKGLGCIGVVFIHVHFPGLFGDFINRSAGFAVPVFFMISGFYAYQASNRTIIRRLRRIFRITLFTVLIYILFRLLNMTNYDELYGAFTPYNIARAAIRLVLVSDLTFIYAHHLWFLVSLIEGYIILLVIKRFNLWKAAYIYALLSFFVLGIILYAHSSAHKCIYKWNVLDNDGSLHRGKFADSLTNQPEDIACLSCGRVSTRAFVADRAYDIRVKRVLQSFPHLVIHLSCK